MKCKIIAALHADSSIMRIRSRTGSPNELVSADGKEVSIGKITIQETPTVCCSHSPSLSV